MFAAAHVVVWMAVALLTQPNAPLDMVEELYWGSEWQWGYYKHPPLPAWLAAGAFELTGGIWGVYLASQFLVVCCLWSAWRVGRELLSPMQALASAALLECSYYYTFTTLDINNTIVARACWSLAVAFLFLALTKERIAYWLLTGVALGLGMLSKYYIAILALAIALFMLFHPRARTALRRPGPYLAAAVAALIFAPHAMWIVANGFSTIIYAVDRSSATSDPWYGHVTFPLGFAAAQLWSLIPASLAVVWLAAWPWRWRFPNIPNRYGAEILAGIIFLPLAIYLVASAVLSLQLRSMYGGPLWTFIGVFTFLFAEMRFSPIRWRRAAVAWAVVALAMVSISVARNVAGPLINHRPHRVHFPGQDLATRVDAIWKERFPGSPPIFAGSWWLAANAAVYTPGDEETYADLDPRISPWTSDKELQERGGVILWRIREGSPFDVPPDVRTRFPQVSRTAKLELPWRTPADCPTYQVGVAIVPPAGSEETRIAREAGDTSLR